MSICGTVKLIESHSGYVICKPNNPTGVDYYYFKLSDYPNLKLEEEHSICWIEDDDDDLQFNSDDTLIAKATSVTSN